MEINDLHIAKEEEEETIDSNCRLEHLERLEKKKKLKLQIQELQDKLDDKLALINYFKEKNDLRYEKELTKLLEKKKSTNLTEILSAEEEEIVDLYNEKYQYNIWEVIENLQTIEVMIINNTIIRHNPKLTEKLKRTIMQNFRSQLDFILKETKILLNYCNINKN